MIYLFEAIIDSDGGLLRVELFVNISNEEGAFAHCWPTDNNGLVVFQSSLLNLTH